MVKFVGTVLAIYASEAPRPLRPHKGPEIVILQNRRDRESPCESPEEE